MDKPKENLTSRLSSRLLMKDLENPTPDIRLFGDREATVSDCHGVCDYEQQMIRLSAGGKTVTFHGRDLELLQLDGEEAVIRGRITAIELV